MITNKVIIYICDRCGKMEFRSAFADENILPMYWKQVRGSNGKVSTDVHLCEKCSDDFDNTFLRQKSDERNNVMQVTGLSFNDD